MVKLGFLIFAVFFACVNGATEDIQQNIAEVKPSDKSPDEKSGGYGYSFSLYDIISLVYKKECKGGYSKADEEKIVHDIHELLAKSKPSGHGSGGGHHTGEYEGHYQEHFSGQYGGPIFGVKPIRPIRPIGLGGGYESGSDEDGSYGGGNYGGGGHGGSNYGGGSHGGGNPIIIVGGDSSESDEHGGYGGGNPIKPIQPIIVGNGYEDDRISFGYCKELALELADSFLHKSFIKVDCFILKKCLKILKGH